MQACMLWIVDLLLWALVWLGQLVRFSGPQLWVRPVCRLRPVCGAASLCSLCAPTPRGFRCGRSAGVSVVGPQSADLGAHNGASGERRGCLSRAQHPGAEGRGVPEAVAAAKSSLVSLSVPLFSFSFWEILPIQATLVQTSTWLLTQLSLALSQESCSRP